MYFLLWQDSTNALDDLETNMEPMSEDVKEEVDVADIVLESNTQDVIAGKNKTTKKLEVNDDVKEKVKQFM